MKPMTALYHLNNIQLFQTKVIEWYRKEGRVFPWRQTKDPFRVLLAEIIMKRTGAERVVEAYEYLVTNYRTPSLLANARLSDVAFLFRSLGLFNRVDLIVNMAKDLDQRFGGKVPDTYEQLVSIRGIGAYTANAVLCLSYGKRVALIDCGVSRVIGSCFGLDVIRAGYRDRALQNVAYELLPINDCREYNLGLIDIGSLFCRHTRLRCSGCPLTDTCAEYTNSLGNAITEGARV